VLERENPYYCTDVLGIETEADFGTISVLGGIFLLAGNCVFDVDMYFPEAE
jgi:hypothetical protein